MTKRGSRPSAPRWSSGENRSPQRVETLLERLRSAYPDAGLLLRFTTPFELLAATVLAARATDEKVNEVTPVLFRRFPTARELAAADVDEVAEIVHPTGFFRQKARRLVAVSQGLVDRFGGEVPETVEELTTLPGVGRKTAILVINHAFARAAGIAVDTHVHRVAQRLDWSHQKDPDRMERELERVVPKASWIDLQGLLATHGRACCKAPKPRCSGCPLDDLCYFPEKVYT